MTHPQLVIVRGANDVGSAIAHLLFLRRIPVVLHDTKAPPHLRRGMSFTDALFDGATVLEDVTCRYAQTFQTLSELLGEQACVPVTDLPLDDVLAALKPSCVVDARMRKHSSPEDLRELAPTVVGLGPGFTVGTNCTVAIETAWGEQLGAVTRSGSPTPPAGEPRPLAGVGRERFVYAPGDGLWRTGRALGSAVTAGEVVGQLDGHDIHAPLSGVLRGLAHDQANVLSRQKIVEVDPRPEADTYGLGTRPKAIAIGVMQALDVEASAQE